MCVCARAHPIPWSYHLCPPHSVLEKHLTPMRSLIQNTLNLNENLQQILKLSKWESVESVDELVQTYQSSPFQLGAGEELVKLHTEVSQWVRSNDCVAKMKGKLLTVQDAKTLLSQGLSLPVSLSCVSVLQEKLDIMQAWISSTEKAFLCPNSQASLLEVCACACACTVVPLVYVPTVVVDM